MASNALATAGTRCVLCGIKLETEVDVVAGICSDCTKRPESRRLARQRPVTTRAPRAFTLADKALIASLHGTIPAQDLLRLLNIRLVADLGPDAPRYTPEQLSAHVRDLGPKASADDWSSLRALLAQARKSGVLASITPQVIDDFCTVFMCSPAQQLHLKDVIANAKGDQ